MKLLTSIQKMNLQPEWFERKAVRTAGTESCANLLKTVEKLRESSLGFDYPPSLDADTVWSQWSSAGFALNILDARQIRTLCVSPKTAARPELVDAAGKNIEILSRTPCMLGFVNAYFANWDDASIRHRLQKLIQSGLQRYSKRNPVILQFKDNASVLFSDGACNSAAEIAIKTRVSVVEWLKQKFISVNSQFASTTLAACITKFINGFPKAESRKRDELWAENVDYALQNLLIDQTTKSEFYRLVDFLILSPA